MADFLSELWGSKPAVIPYTPTTFQQELPATLQENIAAFPDITQLGGLYEQYMMGQFGDVLGPGFQQDILGGVGLATQEQGIARQELAGQIPQDVIDQIMRSSAMTSLLSGTAGGPMGMALSARDLGLTSLQLQQQGVQTEQEAANAIQRWANIAGGLTMRPDQYQITPQQQAALTMQNRLYQQATQQMAANIAAAPDPVLGGLNNLAVSALMAYLGHGMGSSKGSNVDVPYQQNPGFGSNFSQGYQGLPTQGIGGSLGTFFGNVFNTQPQPYDLMGGQGATFSGGVPTGQPNYFNF